MKRLKYFLKEYYDVILLIAGIILLIISILAGYRILLYVSLFMMVSPLLAKK